MWSKTNYHLLNAPHIMLMDINTKALTVKHAAVTLCIQ